MMISALLLAFILGAASAANPCGSYWKYYDGSCYQLFSKAKSQSEATRHCKTHGAGLADIHTQRQAQYIRQHVIGRDPVFIGLKDHNRANFRFWAFDNLEAYYPWLFRSDEPNMPKEERCVLMHYEGNYWNDYYCHRSQNYVCEKQTSHYQYSGMCDSGWQLYSGHCYKISTDKRNWQSARIACQKFGANLAKIETKAENNWLYYKTPASTWIGLNSLGKIGYFSWAEDPTYSNWGTSQGTNNNEKDCVMLNKEGQWIPYVCNAYAATFICEHTKVSVNQECPCNMVQYLDKCYQYFSAHLPFDRANAKCKEKYEGNVMTIKSAKEQELAMALRYARGANDYYWMWVGIGDVLTEGLHQTYPWSATTYTNWQSGEPNNWSNERCVEMKSNGEWNDIRCDWTRSYICQKNIGHKLIL